jgi:hypothetical protein
MKSHKSIVGASLALMISLAIAASLFVGSLPVAALASDTPGSPGSGDQLPVDTLKSADPQPADPYVIMPILFSILEAVF